MQLSHKTKIEFSPSIVFCNLFPKEKMSLESFRWGTQKCIAMTIFSANVAIVKRNYESLTHFTTQGNITTLHIH